MGTDTGLTTFDNEFALRQFSGNQDLLLQILKKFIEQNTHFANELNALLSQGDMVTAKRKVHTLKGVSGNLGMNALHHKCKEIEANIEQSLPVNLLNEFYALVDETLVAANDFSEPTQAPQATSSNQAFIESLEKNEFISDQALTEYVQNSGLSASKQDELMGYIDNFDYPSAIALLNK